MKKNSLVISVFTLITLCNAVCSGTDNTQGAGSRRFVIAKFVIMPKPIDEKIRQLPDALQENVRTLIIATLRDELSTEHSMRGILVAENNLERYLNDHVNPESSQGEVARAIMKEVAALHKPRTTDREIVKVKRRPQKQSGAGAATQTEAQEEYKQLQQATSGSASQSAGAGSGQPATTVATGTSSGAEMDLSDLYEV